MRTLSNYSHSWRKLVFWEKIKVKMGLEMRNLKRRGLLKMFKKIFLKYSKKQCLELKVTNNQKKMLIRILFRNNRKMMDKIWSKMNFNLMKIKTPKKGKLIN